MATIEIERAPIELRHQNPPFHRSAERLLHRLDGEIGHPSDVEEGLGDPFLDSADQFQSSDLEIAKREPRV